MDWLCRFLRLAPLLEPAYVVTFASLRACVCVCECVSALPSRSEGLATSDRLRAAQTDGGRRSEKGLVKLPGFEQQPPSSTRYIVASHTHTHRLLIWKKKNTKQTFIFSSTDLKIRH